ncbi:MAG TPA: hypothetical protein VFD48_09790 [Pyrinomonadaceae bacterium]|nr:hypothetical protein [Pyrinomonadaceae bacterium]
MKTRILYALFLASLVLAGLSNATIAQTRRATAAQPTRGVAPSPRQALLARLPTSDAVAQVDVRRVLSEAVPKLLAGNSAKLAEVDSHIDRFKTRTSLDLRSFDELALGMRYSYPSAGVTKVDTVAVARGTFSPDAIAAAGKGAAAGEYSEEKYLGKTIHIFNVDQQIKLLGLFDLKVKQLAVAPLDANTVALGDLERVRNTIAAGRERRRTNPELIVLATQDPNAIAGFGGNVSPELLQNLRIGNEAIAKDLSTVRQTYGSLALTDKDLELSLAARTLDASSARSLGDTVEGLKQFGALFTNRLSGIRGVLARSALGNLKITTQGNELRIRTAVAQSDIVPLVGGL